jgi:tryptophan synthase beta subunit
MNSYLDTDELGFYGDFGGAYIPELLRPNIEELEQAFSNYRTDAQFLEEYKSLLQ